MLPGIKSIAMSWLYEKAKKKVEKSIKEYKNKGNKILNLPGNKEITRECVKTLINMPIMDKGNRNNFLVSIALGLSEANYSEDEIKDGQNRVQKLTDKFVKEVDEIGKVKEKDIMTV